MDEAWIRRFAAAERTLVVTGAGVSLASGIPTFRGAFMASIDPNAPSPHRRVEPIAEPAEEALPELVAGLRARR